MYQEKKKLEDMAKNLRSQGKTEEQIKQTVMLYLTEAKKNMNPEKMI